MGHIGVHLLFEHILFIYFVLYFKYVFVATKSLGLVVAVITSI